jgi:DTW domain-containing protein YfiP
VCYCAALRTLATTTRIVILQHPRERDMPIGTARMASLCLPNSELHVGIDWSANAALACAIADPARTPILLYPAAGARDILREPPQGPVTLVVVDGTWSQAKTVVRDNPILHALPRYAFATPEPSRYRIRKEPRPEYCSTIEALMHVLGALEGDPARFRSLLDPLNAMVDAQLACQAVRPQRRKRVLPVRPSLRERLPAALRERFADLVLVVAEANAWPYHEKTRFPDELVQIAALRPATGERFEVIAAPAGELSASTPFHTQLAAETICAGVSRADAIAALARFVRPTDVLGAWGHYAPDLIRDSGGTVPDRLDLRAAAQHLRNEKVGSLEDFATRIDGGITPLAQGRAGRRLGALAKIVAAWRRL